MGLGLGVHDIPTPTHKVSVRDYFVYALGGMYVVSVKRILLLDFYRVSKEFRDPHTCRGVRRNISWKLLGKNSLEFLLLI